MAKDHRSFFERLTGSAKPETEEEIFYENPHSRPPSPPSRENDKPATPVDWLGEEEEGQLAVDMYQAPNEIIIHAVVAGVRPDEIDVSITQDLVTIRGKRQKQREITADDYYYQELYWGGFSRSVMMPQEVDVESAEATQKNGLLTIKLPKLDKNRIQKLKVKNE